MMTLINFVKSETTSEEKMIYDKRTFVVKCRTLFDSGNQRPGLLGD